MASGEEKRFDATASRLARAKREGDVPRSNDLTIVASLGCAGCLTLALLWPLGAAARAALVGAARPASYSPLPYVALAVCTLAIVVSALLGALLATYLQAGTLTIRFPAPKFEKLNPVSGLKRMLGRDAAIGGAKALLVASTVAAAAALPVRDTLAAARGGASPQALAAVVVHALQGALFGALGVACSFAIGDVLLERAKWKRRLRMSFDELKRDHKQNEGDPLIRGRRRQQHRALVRGGIARVREAAFVIANPTHVAIALEYRPPEVAVPRVLVRALDAGAQEVKRLAREFRVPIVENVLLARSLLATTDVGECIPSDAYGAVAAIVAMLARERTVVS